MTRTKASNNLAPSRVVAAHAAEPQTILLRPVEDGQGILLDEFVALVGAHAQCVAAAFKRQEKLCAVIVFPCAGVHRAAPQADDDGHMLDAHRALELARAAGGALKRGLLRVVFAEQRLFGARPEVVQIAAQAEDDFFRVEQLAGVVGRAVLRAAAALHAGVGLQADKLRQILAGDQAEVLIAGERRNLGRSCRAREKR